MGFDGDPIGMLAIVAMAPLVLSPITIYPFYSGNKNKYKATKFVLLDGSILFILLKDRNSIAGGTFFYHNIQSVNSYVITDEKIIVKGNITKRKVDERYPNNEYKEYLIDSISVPNVFGNVQLLEQALKNRKQGVSSIEW